MPRMQCIPKAQSTRRSSSLTYNKDILAILKTSFIKPGTSEGVTVLCATSRNNRKMLSENING